MEIEELLKEQERLAADFAASLRGGEVRAAVLARASELQEARVAELKARMESLDRRRKELNARIDGDLEALATELRLLESREDRHLLKPLADSLKPRGTGKDR